MKRCMICKKELNPDFRIPLCAYHKGVGKEHLAKGGKVVGGFVVGAILLSRDTVQNGIENVRDKLSSDK